VSLLLAFAFPPDSALTKSKAHAVAFKTFDRKRKRIRFTSGFVRVLCQPNRFQCLPTNTKTKRLFSLISVSTVTRFGHFDFCSIHLRVIILSLSLDSLDSSCKRIDSHSKVKFGLTRQVLSFSGSSRIFSLLNQQVFCLFFSLTTRLEVNRSKMRPFQLMLLMQMLFFCAFVALILFSSPAKANVLR
jgi:hypothetical protein